MDEHTRGRWYADKHPNDPSWRVNNGFATIASVGTGLGMEPETVEANARLMAAAPELLSALRAFVNDHDDGSVDCAIYQDGVNAIIAATGRVD